jgi:CheY-like chemotaxis protein
MGAQEIEVAVERNRENFAVVVGAKERRASWRGGWLKFAASWSIRKFDVGGEIVVCAFREAWRAELATLKMTRCEDTFSIGTTQCEGEEPREVQRNPRGTPDLSGERFRRAFRNEFGGSMAIQKILLIDDDDDLRQVAALSMRKTAGWEVLVANSGPRGIKLALEHRPDRTLLDVMTPDMDGPATLAQMESHDALVGQPVIFITAGIQTSEIAELMVLGAAGVIGKPLNPLSLAEAVLRLAEAR